MVPHDNQMPHVVEFEVEFLMSKQLSADVKALLDRMYRARSTMFEQGRHPRSEPLSLEMGIELAELLAKAADELETLEGRPFGRQGLL
ncbi:MAG TPA: hypothetical protein VEF72_19435 [Mycobacterium sp.]|nr:hypothetical protein [Mycobacterium sp.]